MDEEAIPKPGEWPVDPQEDQPILEDRIWIDGCFDFFHHGHAGVLLQARRLGTTLTIGIHSDASILHNKGPTVMSLPERVLAVSANRWSTHAIPHAPYVTSLDWISHYGCKYVVHGDDITSDAGGEDCYRFVKEAGRFKVVKRTPGISTTDLVGRMLVGGRGHFVGSLRRVVREEENMPWTGKDGREEREVVEERLRAFASDETGVGEGVGVFFCEEDREKGKGHGTDGSENGNGSRGYQFEEYITGKPPLPGQRIVYVDGGWDLFSSGHISFLREVVRVEEEKARASGWNHKYSPCYIVAGIHDDKVINEVKGGNYPIMNVYERSLCVLQCKYISTLILSAPLTPTATYLSSLPHVNTPPHQYSTSTPSTVYHGSTTYLPHPSDPYADAKKLGIFEQIGVHDFQHVNAEQIVGRILERRGEFEERQRRKEGKGVREEEVRRGELGV